MKTFENIAIVGLGLIGASFAMALKEIHPKHIWGIDQDEDTLKKAIKKGIINENLVDSKKILKQSDLVILCIYPQDIEAFIQKHKDDFKKGCIIMDTAGIKEKLVQFVQKNIREDLQFVGGHPMAGREYKGMEYGCKDLFKKATFLITPTDKNQPRSIKKIQEMIYAIGFKKIVSLSSKEHDQMIAYTSGLPHILAAALINGCKYDNIEPFCAGSFKDATRVSRMNEVLWSQLLIGNLESTVKEIEGIEKEIKKIKHAIIKKDSSSLEKLFKEATKKKEDLIKQCMN